MTRTYLGLGSNLGDRQRNLSEALEALRERGIRVLATSPVYETEPWGVADQPRYLNAACAVGTCLPPIELLDALKRIEKQMGRVRSVRYGPRPIDLDILLYGDLLLNTPRLCIPHAGMLERASVLVPLADIAPDQRHPVTHLTIAQHLALLGGAPGIAPFPPGLP